MLWQVAEIIPKELWGCLCLEWTRGIIFDNIDPPNQNHSTEIHLFPCRDLWPATEFNVTRLHVSFGVPVSLSFVDVLSAGPTCKAGVKNPPSARNNRLFLCLLLLFGSWKDMGWGMCTRRISFGCLHFHLTDTCIIVNPCLYQSFGFYRKHPANWYLYIVKRNLYLYKLLNITITNVMPKVELRK